MRHRVSVQSGSSRTRRQLILALTEGDESAGQIVRAVRGSGVDVLALNIGSPEDAVISAARLRPNVVVAELASSRHRLGPTLDTVRRASGFSPVLLLHRKTVPIQGPTHTYADAHLVEPFSLEQVHAELEALLHPEREPATWVMRIGELELNPVSREVTHDGALIELTRLEFDLLRFLLRNPDTVLSRGQILAHVWPQPGERTDNIVDVYVAQLRKKIDHVHSPIIHTVRGVGYIVKLACRRDSDPAL
jgi:two-component system, OmpR family, response regulator